MPGNRRPTGIDAVGDVPWSTHVCQFYRSEQDLLDVVVPYLRAGLDNNEYCLWITAESVDTKKAKRALRKVVSNLDQYLATGQIEIIPYTEWFCKKGILDLSSALERLLEKYHQIKVDDYEGVRVACDVTSVKNDDITNLLEFEEAIDNTIGDYRIVVLCSYGVERFETAEIVDIVSRHQLALIQHNGRWVGIESAERKRAQEALKRVDDSYPDST